MIMKAGACWRNWAFALGILSYLCAVSRADDQRIKVVVNKLNDYGYRTFSDLLVLTGVKDVLDDSKGVNLFVPTEEAFKNFFSNLVQRGWNTSFGGSVEELPVDVLTMITQYHILPRTWGIDGDQTHNGQVLYPVGPGPSSFITYFRWISSGFWHSEQEYFSPDSNSNWPNATIGSTSPHSWVLSGEYESYSAAVWDSIDQVLIPQPAAEELERLLIAQFPLPPLS